MTPGLLRHTLYVALGSGVGGVLRVLATLAVGMPQFFPFPVEILLVNVIGSFLVGYGTASTGHNRRWPLSEEVRHFLLPGVCGGFTTFSLFSLQSLQLIEAGDLAAAMAYGFTTLILSIAAVVTGYRCGM